jgi:hypothetical protein
VKYPDDPDAQTLYADSILVRSRWHWYDLSGAPAPGVSEAEDVLQSVIRRFPQHPGANHLYIHSIESPPTPERGVASAQRLMGIEPVAGWMNQPTSAGGEGETAGRRLLPEVATIVTSETVLAWHRKLIGQKYDGSCRPSTAEKSQALVGRMARENRD